MLQGFKCNDVNKKLLVHTGVYLSLGDVTGIVNNTCVPTTDVGSSIPHQLVCITDRMPCCLDQPWDEGQWYYPNGTEVEHNSRSSNLAPYHMNRTDNGRINLFRFNDSVLNPNGKFCCKATDRIGVLRTLCVDLD